MSKEGGIFVATCLVTLALHGNSTLKGKRSVLNRVKSRVKNEFNVSVSEVAAQDRLQTAVLGLAAISGDRVYLQGLVDKAVRFIGGISSAEIADVQVSIEQAGGHAFV
jgi:uncharacterized protein YlxP (DUF503 family)